MARIGDKTSYEDAAALPLPYTTAVIGLFRRLEIQEPGAASSGDKRGAVLVWGGATTVGVYAIQLAKVRTLLSRRGEGLPKTRLCSLHSH